MSKFVIGELVVRKDGKISTRFRVTNISEDGKFLMFNDSYTRHLACDYKTCPRAQAACNAAAERALNEYHAWKDPADEQQPAILSDATSAKSFGYDSWSEMLWDQARRAKHNKDVASDFHKDDESARAFWTRPDPDMVITKVCNKCQHENVNPECDMTWNYETQSWRVNHIYDYGYCEDCCTQVDILDFVPETCSECGERKRR